MAHNNFTGGSCKICRWEHLLVLQVPGAESQPALALLVPHSPLKKITAFKSCIYECKMLLNSNSFVSCHSHTVHSAPLKCARAGGALRCATTTSSQNSLASPKRSPVPVICYRHLPPQPVPVVGPVLDISCTRNHIRCGLLYLASLTEFEIHPRCIKCRCFAPFHSRVWIDRVVFVHQLWLDARVVPARQ